jgi:hypothetical protein
MKIITLRTLASTCVLLLLLIVLSSLAVADNPPPIIPTKPTPTPVPPSGGGGGGGGGDYTPPVVTPSPTPSPVPLYRLDTPLPSKVVIGTVPVKIEGTQVSVPLGYEFSDVIKNDTFEVPITMNDGASARLLVTVEPSGSQTGVIKSMHLIAKKTLNNSAQEIGVMVDIALSNLPAGSSFSFDLKPTNSVDMSEINRQLATYSDKKFNPAPLLVFEATKNGLQNGRDITGAKFIFTVPRPAGFDPSADYYVIRQSDSMMEVLNATLVGSPDADPLTYEVVSPHGLSTFALVGLEPARPTVVQVTPIPAPSPSPAPGGLSGGLSGYILVFSTFVIGLVAGIAVLMIFLWLRIR